MSISLPYHRNYREMIGHYSDWAYIVDKSYSNNPQHYIRAFLMIQSDLIKLFEFIEPADENIKTFSFRIHSLFMRTCIEIEANFKAILQENIYTPKDKKGKKRKESAWNISDYKLIDKTHHLSSYTIELPIWNGSKNKFNPFSDWRENKSLFWYKAYNQSKHDRQNNFKKANFENLMNAVSALLILLSSQFKRENFSPGPTGLSVKTASYYSGNFGIGNYFIVNFPTDWQEDEKYEFEWSELSKRSVKFQKINYDNI